MKQTIQWTGSYTAKRASGAKYFFGLSCGHVVFRNASALPNSSSMSCSECKRGARPDPAIFEWWKERK